MLTSLYQALADRLSGLGVSLYHADCVPADAAFPYITFEAAAPLAPGRSGQLALTVWACGEAAHAQRLHLADALLAVLPARGLYLALAEGAAILAPPAGTETLQSGSALGLRLTWTLEYHPSKGESA